MGTRAPVCKLFMSKDPGASPCSAPIVGWAHSEKSQQKSYLPVAKVLLQHPRVTAQGLSVRTLLGFLTLTHAGHTQLRQAGPAAAWPAYGCVPTHCCALPAPGVEGPCAVLPRPAGVLRHPRTASPSTFRACFPAI